ncbi:hypothetical protein CWI37_0885p0010 [Hamiltosporidium tvaerminnensis]|uniref:SANT domain-containing protein n=2 Tax=Hamiltosporidium tvaerminnensis TaxID=1176355 RepID=A0A4Q9L1A5_9MICR|nr:hypothetical protein CWI37_0885p0010 [Hamiltosporidium tvaerminnensis]
MFYNDLHSKIKEIITTNSTQSPNKRESEEAQAYISEKAQAYISEKAQEYISEEAQAYISDKTQEYISEKVPDNTQCNIKPHHLFNNTYYLQYVKYTHPTLNESEILSLIKNEEILSVIRSNRNKARTEYDIGHEGCDSDCKRCDNEYKRSGNEYKRCGNEGNRRGNEYNRCDNEYKRRDNEYKRCDRVCNINNNSVYLVSYRKVPQIQLPSYFLTERQKELFKEAFIENGKNFDKIIRYINSNIECKESNLNKFDLPNLSNTNNSNYIGSYNNDSCNNSNININNTINSSYNTCNTINSTCTNNTINSTCNTNINNTINSTYNTNNTITSNNTYTNPHTLLITPLKIHQGVSYYYDNKKKLKYLMKKKVGRMTDIDIKHIIESTWTYKDKNLFNHFYTIYGKMWHLYGSSIPCKTEKDIKMYYRYYRKYGNVVGGESSGGGDSISVGGSIDVVGGNNHRLDNNCNVYNNCNNTVIEGKPFRDTMDNTYFFCSSDVLSIRMAIKRYKEGCVNNGNEREKPYDFKRIIENICKETYSSIKFNGGEGDENTVVGDIVVEDVIVEGGDKNVIEVIEENKEENKEDIIEVSKNEDKKDLIDDKELNNTNTTKTLQHATPRRKRVKRILPVIKRGFIKKISKRDILSKWSINNRQLFAIYFPYFNKNWVMMSEYFSDKKAGDLRIYYRHYYKNLSMNEQKLELSLREVERDLDRESVSDVGVSYCRRESGVVYLDMCGIIFEGKKK